MDQNEANRRARITQRMREQTGVDERLIEKVVRAFYARVRSDEFLGPIFETRIREWEPHLQRMCDFWSSVVLSSGVYHGQPMRMHLALPVDARHFDRWLALFELTSREVCGDRVAEYFIEPARRIATSLELGIASSQGVLVGKGERFDRTSLRRIEHEQGNPEPDCRGGRGCPSRGVFRRRWCSGFRACRARTARFTRLTRFS